MYPLFPRAVYYIQQSDHTAHQQILAALKTQDQDCKVRLREQKKREERREIATLQHVEQLLLVRSSYSGVEIEVMTVKHGKVWSMDLMTRFIRHYSCVAILLVLLDRSR